MDRGSAQASYIGLAHGKKYISNAYLLFSTLQAVVSPGHTLRYEGRETTASTRVLL